MCGADYALPAEPALASARAAPFTNKTGWYRQPLKRLAPALPVAENMPSDRFATAAADEDNEPAATVDSDDIGDVTEEQDEADVAGQFERAHSGEDEPR
jgi:hypothetical protein